MALSKVEFSRLDKLRNASPEALDKFIQIMLNRPGNSLVLDIGAGSGRHTNILRKYGLKVQGIDLDPGNNTIYLGDYSTYTLPIQFQGVWCNHVLEHQVNVQVFLQKIMRDTVNDGWIAITVPKAYLNDPPHKIVSGHVTMWNAGLLLYNMILAGLDCSDAMVRTSKYNVSVITKNRWITNMPQLTMNRGDIERLSPYFPFKAEQGFDGDISEINWDYQK